DSDPSCASLERQSLGCRDLRIRGLADLPPAQWSDQPRDVLPAAGPAEEPDELVDHPGADRPDESDEPADAGRCGVAAGDGGGREIQASIISRVVERAASLWPFSWAPL